VAWASQLRPPKVGEVRKALRAALRRPHLPQGAPTSPALANLCAFRLDLRLHAYCGRVGARYTRYADDLAISGGPQLRRQADRLVEAVGRLAADEGFRLNPAKTRVQGRAGRQGVTGLVVNGRPNLPRAEYDALKAVLHNAARTGLEAQNRAGHRDVRAHLAGRIAWMHAVHPVRAARLRAALDAVQD